MSELGWIVSAGVAALLAALLGYTAASPATTELAPSCECAPPELRERYRVAWGNWFDGERLSDADADALVEVDALLGRCGR